jgi:hypothetical protein
MIFIHKLIFISFSFALNINFKILIFVKQHLFHVIHVHGHVCLYFIPAGFEVPHVLDVYSLPLCVILSVIPLLNCGIVYYGFTLS